VAKVIYSSRPPTAVLTLQKRVVLQYDENFSRADLEDFFVSFVLEFGVVSSAN
jgi:hypothetical protein